MIETDERMGAMILERVAAVACREVHVHALTGSTTIRIAIGLILNDLGSTNPNFPGGEKSAWEMLDRYQRAFVWMSNPEYRKIQWSSIPLPYP